MTNQDAFNAVDTLKAAGRKRNVWVVSGLKYDPTEKRRKDGLPKHVHMLTVTFHDRRRAQAAARFWRATKEYHYVGVNGNYWSD